MTADHLLHLRFDPRWGPQWDLTCHHELGEYPTVDEDTGDESPECWAPDWFGEMSIDDVLLGGEWPEKLCFPLPVQIVWDEGLTLRPLDVRPIS